MGGFSLLSKARFPAALAAVLLAVLVAVGCDQRPPAPTPSPSATRIISHAPSFTELVFALGKGDRVVAVSDYCLFPPEVRGLPRIGGLLNPNLERALSLKPDLILLADTQRDLIRRYESLGVRTLALPSGPIDGLFPMIEKIGAAVGAPEEAARLSERIKNELDAVRKSVAGRDPVRAAFVVEHQPGELRGVYVAGPESFNSALLGIAGGKNVFGDLSGSYVNVSVEQFVERDPDVIIVMGIKPTVTEAEKAAEKDVWKKLASVSAVKTGRVYLISVDPISVPGPRVGESARILSDLLFEKGS